MTKKPDKKNSVSFGHQRVEFVSTDPEKDAEWDARTSDPSALRSQMFETMAKAVDQFAEIVQIANESATQQELTERVMQLLDVDEFAASFALTVSPAHLTQEARAEFAKLRES